MVEIKDFKEKIEVIRWCDMPKDPNYKIISKKRMSIISQCLVKVIEYRGV